MNPLKLAAQYRRLEDARRVADDAGKKWWLEWKANGGSDQSELNAACRKLDELAPGEGSRVESAIALNAFASLARSFSELSAESREMRSRLSALESERGKNIIRSADTPSESSSLGESSGEGI